MTLPSPQKPAITMTTPTPPQSQGQSITQLPAQEAIRDVPILCLPNEISNQIIGYLQPHDRYHLSKTCRWTRVLANQDWAALLLDLPQPERAKFLYGVAAHMNNVWVCRLCPCLRPINSEHVPRRWGMLEISKRRPPDYTIAEAYGYKEMHIQMAVKLHSKRDLSDTQAAYLAEILRPYTFTTQVESGSNDLRLEQRVTPRIVNGRFMLQCCWVMEKSKENIKSSEVVGLAFCPHMNVAVQLCLRARFGGKVNPLIQDHLPEELDGSEIKGSCSSCMTDFAVIFHRRRIEGKGWYALGSCQQFTDREFLSHIPQHYDLFRIWEPRSIRRGPSLRNMYYEDEHRPSRQLGGDVGLELGVPTMGGRPMGTPRSLAQLLFPST